MVSITIRNPDDNAKTRLRVRAAEHHRSVKEEAQAGDPARRRGAQAWFAEPRECHLLAFRAEQWRGPRVAAT